MAADPIRGDGASGESAVTAVFGVGIFLAFLLLSSQVLVYLYASSTVAAVAFDAATVAAGRASGDPRSGSTQAAAEVTADALLGDLAGADGGAAYTWRVLPRTGGSSEVALRISVPYPSVVAGGFGLDRISREARVTIEEDPAP